MTFLLGRIRYHPIRWSVVKMTTNDFSGDFSGEKKWLFDWTLIFCPGLPETRESREVTWENWMGSEWLRMGHSIPFLEFHFLFISIKILFISYSFPILSHSILFSLMVCQNLVHSIPIQFHFRTKFTTKKTDFQYNLCY